MIKKELKMSHEINTQILERLAEDVAEMSDIAVVNEALDRPESMHGTSPFRDLVLATHLPIFWKRAVEPVTLVA